MHPPCENLHVGIIGGGLAGLALGIGLSYRHVSFTIFEAAPGLNAIGAGISLGPNTTRAMALIDPALREGYEKIAVKNRSPERQHNFADFLLAEPGFGAARGFHGAAVGSRDFVRSGAHRKDLLGTMMSLLPPDGCVRFGSKAASVCQVGSRVHVNFEDGQVAEFDAVVGCDGGKGITRRAVLGQEFPDQVQLTYSGRYVYRALVPPGKAHELLGGYADDSKIFIGQGRYFAAYPTSGGCFNFVGGRQTDEPWTHSHSTQQVSKEDMRSDFDGCDPRLLRLLEWAKPLRWGLFHHVDTPTYTRGRIVLLGDVAHASTPHQGAGAGQCFEDALVLSHLLGEIRHVGEIPAALEVYDSICRPRAQEIVRTSNETGLMYTMKHPQCKDDVAKIVANAKGRSQWIWTHDLKADLVKASRGLEKLRSKRK
ncbi:mannitol 1-phosphate dehydrogenase [Metarhizium album ARSEF 1941]|uniref:Mannitol 1-phosphate dehydrogenase n=1 Tax=Metarhizium album (strain ARSEF 1941) TaxID=1081103 RepID=A0A0B2X7G7_METAS|nr:mannitol 1-phosphate dehydrogenase [Metarhizium album ARSEF 1941]KHO01450.1 mannitol 1-phosphate dehydrogenase [Metarhizium album ARSEF 1941]